MKQKTLTPIMFKILRESHFAYLCTTDQNNQSHITPMFFVFDEATSNILVLTHMKSKKMRNIQVNPKVCLTVDVRDPQNPFENMGVMVQGEASIEKTVDSFSAAQDQNLMKVFKEYNKKYPVLSEEQAVAPPKYQEFTQALVRVRANKMVYWKGPHFTTVELEHNP